jgi:hypothetical protein
MSRDEQPPQIPPDPSGDATNVIQIEQSRKERAAKNRRKAADAFGESAYGWRESTLPRGEQPENLYFSRVVGEDLPAANILDGDHLLVSVCEDVPNGTLAAVKRATDGLIGLGYFYRQSDGSIRLEKRPLRDEDDGISIPCLDVASIARVIRIERDIPSPQQGGKQ